MNGLCRSTIGGHAGQYDRDGEGLTEVEKAAGRLRDPASKRNDLLEHK